jgi:putative copper resistance protein D
MLALTIIGARLAQFTCATALFGAPLFFLYGLPGAGPGAAIGLRWPRPLLLGAAVVLALAVAIALSAQTAVMNDSAAAALQPEAIVSVVGDTQFGLVTAVRLGLAILTWPILIIAKPSQRLWIITSILGAAILASFAWTGHGASDEGASGIIHLVADLLHLLAAGVWLGALVVLGMLLASARRNLDMPALNALHDGLAGFSGVGTAVVAALVATGLINSWFLIGPAHVGALFSSTYGLLLCAKLAIFAGMLGLAAINRFRLTPALASALRDGSVDDAVRALQRSVVIESVAALVVLGLVSALGTLPPISADV